MPNHSDTIEQPKDQLPTSRNLQRDGALEALRRLREVGERLPAVDAVAVIRDGRELADPNSV